MHVQDDQENDKSVKEKREERREINQQFVTWSEKTNFEKLNYVIYKFIILCPVVVSIGCNFKTVSDVYMT